MTIEKALREALAAHDAAIVLDPAKGYHFGGGPSIEEIAKSIAARLTPAASARAGAVTEFPWTMHDGHTLWRTRGTTVDAHWPDRCAKCSGVEVPAASARAGGAQYREAVEALRDEFYRTLPPAGHPIVRGFAQRVLALLAAAPVSEAGRDGIDVERLAAAIRAVWPSHTEGTGSYPPSGNDRTWKVFDPAVPTRPFIERIAAEYSAAGPRDAGE